jgi:hypothetical protein
MSAWLLAAAASARYQSRRQLIVSGRIITA